MLPARQGPPPKPIPIHQHALDNLRFIRETMERASSFTAVPGWGGVAMGASAILAALVAGLQPDPRRWLAVWLIEALAALAIGVFSMWRKAARGHDVAAAPARKFALSFAPPVAAAALLTIALAGAGQFQFLPALWLLMYGIAITASGAFSVPAIPVMGLCFTGLGTVCLFSPATWGNWFLLAGFGMLHITFGIWIARRYGG